MKDYKITKYGDYFQVSYNDYYNDRKYKNYEDAVNDIYKYYQYSNTYEPESKQESEERLRKEKVEKRNSKIEQILG
jgi:hypothetical protein